jgi:iron complex transport system substrate-binding protein
MRSPVVLIATLVVGALALTGCGPADPGTTPSPSTTSQGPLAELDLAPDPRNWDGPSSAVLASEAVEPVAENPQQQLPASVTSHDHTGDVPVVVDDTSRVIALDLAGSISATVWGLGLGSTLVGRDMSTTFAGVDDLPVVTSGAHAVNAEAVLALRPTLVLTDGSVGPRDVLEQLRSAGVTVVFVENTASYEGAAELARQVGAALGVAEVGVALADRIAADVEAKIAEIAAISPTDPDDQVRVMFLYLRGGAGITYLFGKESGADILIKALGARDVAGELGWAGEKPVTDEAIIAADPDRGLVMTNGIESVGGVDGLLAAKPALALTGAGEHRRFVDMADGDILSFGPRSAAVLDALARAIYAPVKG